MFSFATPHRMMRPHDQRTIALALIALYAVQGPIAASENQHSQCMAASGGVTVDMLDCIGSALEAAEMAVSDLQETLVQSVNSEMGVALGTAQEDWVSYRFSTCQAEAFAAGTGSFSSVALLDCTLRITTERLQWLEHLSANPDLVELSSGSDAAGQ